MDAAALPLWRAPALSMRWWPVFRRNLLVWRKLALPSLIGNIAEPLIWLVAFGYGMGALVGSVRLHGTDVPYILFLASGSICMSAMNAAALTSVIPIAANSKLPLADAGRKAPVTCSQPAARSTPNTPAISSAPSTRPANQSRHQAGRRRSP